MGRRNENHSRTLARDFSQEEGREGGGGGLTFYRYHMMVLTPYLTWKGLLSDLSSIGGRFGGMPNPRGR